VNPFRASIVLGTPGSGKSYAVVNSFIKQQIEKGFSMYVYDFKFSDLSTIAYNHLLNHPEGYKVKLPDNHGGYVETQMSSARTHLDLKIVCFGTSTIIGTYSVDGQGVDIGTQGNDRLTLAHFRNNSCRKRQFENAYARTFQGCTDALSGFNFFVGKLRMAMKPLKLFCDIGFYISDVCHFTFPF